MIAYMDSSAVVKGCVLEAGSDAVGDACERALSGELEVAFSAWNVGEVLGVLDRYLRRGWLGREDYKAARLQFIGETLRLIRLKLVKSPGENRASGLELGSCGGATFTRPMRSR